MVSNLDDLIARLRARHYPNLEIHHEVFAGEHHSTMFPAGFTRALVTLYGR